MKKIVFLIFLSSALLNSQNKYVTCDAYNTVTSEMNICVDTLFFNCQRSFLIQDNAIMRIKNVVGIGEIKRGGKAGAPTINGIDRFEGDASPTIILDGCSFKFNNLEIHENISITYINNYCNEN